MIYYARIEEELITGYYTKEIHGYIPKNSIPITEQLWQHLLEYNKTLVDIEKLSLIPATYNEETPLTIDYKDLFFANERDFETTRYISKENRELDELKNKIEALEAFMLDLTQGNR